MKYIKITQQIFENKLKMLPFNRDYKVRKDLVKHMRNFGYSCPVNLFYSSAITGKRELWVADGQHRLLTANFLGIEADGVIHPEEFDSIERIVSYVASLNSAQKPWSPRTYIDCYCYLNYPEYKELVQTASKTPFSITTIATLLYGVRKYTTGYSVLNHIKEGTFHINNREATDYTIKLAAELGEYQPLTNRMVLALGYVSSLRAFNEEAFSQKYQENAEAIKELKLNDYSDLFISWIQ